MNILEPRQVELEQLIVASVAAAVELPAPEIDPERAFTELGVDSVGAAEVAGQLGDRLGFDVEPELLFDHPTPAALAEFLTTASAARP